MSAADEAYKSLDEERAFILYMRYVFIWRIVRQSNEYKKNTVRVRKLTVGKCGAKAEIVVLK